MQLVNRIDVAIVTPYQFERNLLAAMEQAQISWNQRRKINPSSGKSCAADTLQALVIDPNTC
jgi:hypothetical protein